MLKASSWNDAIDPLPAKTTATLIWTRFRHIFVLQVVVGYDKNLFALRLLREPLCMYVQSEYTRSLSVFLSLSHSVSIFLSFLFLISNKSLYSICISTSNQVCFLVHLTVGDFTLRLTARVTLELVFYTFYALYTHGCHL
jgi:hypothetical protein